MSTEIETDVQGGELVLKVSLDAVKQLREWGLGDLHLEQLLKELVRYDYANCPAKVQLMQGVYYATGKSGRAFAVIPYYYDGIDNGVGGECGTIAAKIQHELHTNGFVDSLHANPDTDNIHVVRAMGEGNEFFRNGNHVWCGIVQDSDRDGIPSNEDMRQMVVIDGAQQKLMMQDQTGYQVREFTNPYNRESGTAVHAVVQVAEMEIDPFTGYVVDEYRPDTLIMGLSADRGYSYGLAFIFDSDELLPTIVIGHPDSENYALAYRNPVTREIVLKASDASFTTLQKSHWKEIDAMIINAEGLSYSEGLPEGVEIGDKRIRSWDTT